MDSTNVRNGTIEDRDRECTLKPQIVKNGNGESRVETRSCCRDRDVCGLHGLAVEPDRPPDGRVDGQWLRACWCPNTTAVTPAAVLPKQRGGATTSLPVRADYGTVVIRHAS